MKLLWVNPTFLDYRIPLYVELNKLCDGKFFVIYGKNRPQRIVDKTNRALGDNAAQVKEERIITLKSAKSNFANSGLYIRIPKGLYGMIKSIKPDVLIAEGFFKFTPWALVYSALHHKPLYISYERTSHTERNCPWWRKAYRRFVGLFVTGYIVNGIQTKEYLMSQGVRAERIHTGSMCADSKELAIGVRSFNKNGKEFFRKKICNQYEGLVFIFVGRLIELKGVTQMLEAWRKYEVVHPEDTLLLIGDGDKRKEVEALADLCKNVKVLGAVDYDEVYKYYAIADVFIIPTLEDNWSLVVPEAMACGLPIACSIYNGCYPELVHEGENGKLFDPLNKKNIVEVLDYFHGVDIKAFGNRSVEIEHCFNPENTAKRIFDVVQKNKY